MMDKIVTEKEGQKGEVPSWVRSIKPFVVLYLCEHSEVFVRLNNLQEQTWNSEEDDVNDNPSPVATKNFFEIMKAVGQDMHRETGAMDILESRMDSYYVLDLCMAPGGLLHAALSIRPDAGVRAFSLPPSAGGHEVQLPESLGIETTFVDINLLTGDMAITSPPHLHPEMAYLLPQQMGVEDRFDLVICDGQVVCTHQRSELREIREAGRLLVTQIILGIKHLCKGGTMIVLLQRLESPDTVNLLHAFSQFSTITLFKSKKSHKKRGSFYMIAKNIQPGTKEALRLVREYKRQWWKATFGTDEEHEEYIRERLEDTESILPSFGPRLIELGEPIWNIQAQGFLEASSMKPSSSEHKTSRQIRHA